MARLAGGLPTGTGFALSDGGGGGGGGGLGAATGLGGGVAFLPNGRNGHNGCFVRDETEVAQLREVPAEEIQTVGGRGGDCAKEPQKTKHDLFVACASPATRPATRRSGGPATPATNAWAPVKCWRRHLSFVWCAHHLGEHGAAETYVATGGGAGWRARGGVFVGDEKRGLAEELRRWALL